MNDIELTYCVLDGMWCVNESSVEGGEADGDEWKRKKCESQKCVKDLRETVALAEARDSRSELLVA